MLHPKIKVEELNDQIYGIDIHPLSVQIAKTTLPLAFGREVVSAKKPVHLNITLANTLLAPKSFYEIYKGFKQVKEAGRDSIWKFTVQSICKPYFLKSKFDYIVGNPPPPELTASHLGRLRVEIKKHIEIELQEIGSLYVQ